MNVLDCCIDIASLAVQAMLYEVSCNPSPGLINKESLGAHQDMDYFTFLDSTTVLINPLIRCVEAGFSSKTPSEIFNEIRLIGKTGEQRMFQKTSGVNTHKGMLFLLGVCCAAAGKLIYTQSSFSALQEIIMQMTEGLVERELRSKRAEFSKADPASLSHGEWLYLRYNSEGIRGEVERGIPLVFSYSLEFYRAQEGLSKNKRLIQTLLAIMQYCEDSNILYRHSLNTLKEVQDKAKQTLALGGIASLKGTKAIEEMAKDFSIRKISPGGSADLLGVTVFLDLLEKYFKEEIG